MAFKHIRAQIAAQHAGDGLPTKTIAVTSPERGDGKTFVSANLAISMAQLEKKTVLVDCDFRNPSLPWLFGYKQGDGLSSLLNVKCSLDDILVRQRVPFLDILPAGWSPNNPSELISNDKFRVLLEHLKRKYDYIVIDCPPAASIVDASIIASLADSVIMTAGFRKTKRDIMLVALKRILQVSHKHIYGILNNVWEVQDFNSFEYLPLSEINIEKAMPMDSKADLERFERNLGQKKAG